MMKRSAAALALLLSVACASTDMSSPAETGGGSSAAAITSDARNAPDYIVLTAPNQVRTWDFGNSIGVRALHIRGTMTNRGFIPAGEIQGSGKFCESGSDWLSLTDLRVYKSTEKSPTAPYVLGCAQGSQFQPASRAIVTQ